MSDPGVPPRGPAEPPQYTRYRARPRLLDRATRRAGSPLDELRHGRASGGRPGRRMHRRWSAGRIVKWLALAAVGWILLSLVLFLASAQIERGKVSDEAQSVLAGGGT